MATGLSNSDIAQVLVVSLETGENACRERAWQSSVLRIGRTLSSSPTSLVWWSRGQAPIRNPVQLRLIDLSA